MDTMNNHRMMTNGVRQTAVTNRKKWLSSWRRLKQDYLMIMKDPAPYVTVAPLPSDLLEWHYVIRGPENSVYSGGIYHGKLKFPVEYPFKPPSIYMTTPNGRFETNTRLCLSISDYHPDSWNPTWSLSTILTGLLSFMLEEHNAVGSVQTPDHLRRTYAKKSLQFNLNDPLFVELFPEIAKEIKLELEKIKLAEMESLAKKNAAQQNGKNSSNSNQQQSETQQRLNRFVWSCIYNLIAVIVVVLFVFIVQWVLQSDKSIINH